MSASTWLDLSISRDDTLLFVPSRTVFRSSSSNSLDLSTAPVLNNYEPILAQSITAVSLAPSEYDLGTKTPPFPRGLPRKSPCAMVNLAGNLALPKNGIRGKVRGNVLLSSPTPSRLKNIPKLKPRLEIWSAATSRAQPPGVASWSPAIQRSKQGWLSEGSIVPASYLKRKLLESRGLPARSLPSSLDPVLFVSAPPPYDSHDTNRRPLPRPASFSSRTDLYRESHALDSKIQHSSRDKQRRWSVSSLPSYVNADLVQSHLDSQSFDSLNEEDMDSITASPSQDGEMVVPEIRVSTSSSTIPDPVPSPDSAPSHSAPLAVRRGLKVPSPLTLKKSGPLEVDPYPSIPTAFRGSPVEYSPQFKLAAAPSTPTEVDDMIKHLRLQVVDMKPLTPQESEMGKPTAPVSASTSADSMPSTSPGDSRPVSGCLSSEDEWAFAREFMASSGDPLPIRSPKKTRSTVKSPTSLPAPEARYAKVTSRISTPTPKPGAAPCVRPKSAPVTKESRSPLPTQQNKRPSVRLPRVSDIPARPTSRSTSASGTTSRKSNLPSPRPLSAVSAGSDLRYRPRTPELKKNVQSYTPLTPDSSARRTSTPSQDPKMIQGILKHTRNVRFAPPPNRPKGRGSSTRGGQPQGGPLRGSLRVPSPLRQSFAPESQETPSTGGPQIRARARMSLAVENPAGNRRMSVAVVTDRRRTFDPSTTRTPTPEMRTLRGGAFNTLPSPATPTLAVPSPAASPATDPCAKPRGRKSLSLLSGGGDTRDDKDKGKGSKGKDKDKENRSPFRLSLAPSPKRRAEASGDGNENRARRQSVAVVPASSTEGGSWSGRGRLSSPLRSLLGRLRS